MNNDTDPKNEFEKEQILEHLLLLSRRRSELLQLSKRLKELLPKRLQKQKDHYQKKKHKPGKSLRLSLLDKSYINSLNELIDTRYEYNHTKIKWEITKMKLSIKK